MTKETPGSMQTLSLAWCPSCPVDADTASSTAPEAPPFAKLAADAGVPGTGVEVRL